MSKRKTGHTTTKNTQKKRVKQTNADFQNNVDQLSNEPVVGVICVIENNETITPVRFAFPKIHLSNYVPEPGTDLLSLRETVMKDVGSLYYSVTNYDLVKPSLDNLPQKGLDKISQADLFNRLVEAIGAYVTVVSQIEKETITNNFGPYHSVGVIFGFTYNDNPETGDFNIIETPTGFNFTDFESWMESTNKFKEEVAATGITGQRLSEAKIIKN